VSRDANILKAVRFERPDAIPMVFHINDACRHSYPQGALQELMAEHPLLFPGLTSPSDPVPPSSYLPNARKGERYTDPWGCVWKTTEDGIVGVVVEHPLADWAALDAYEPPPLPGDDGDVTPQWDVLASQIAADSPAAPLIRGGLPHGHTFLRLCDLRGYQNLLFDMVDDDPRLHVLIEMVENHNRALIQHDLRRGATWMAYPEDLGMQVGPMLSPEQFRTYLKPSYERLMRPAREAGCIVHMHSDGDIRALVDDMVESGVEVVNLQDVVNGIDWIAARFAGKICIDLDIDRQSVTVNGSPTDIDNLIREEVEKLGSKEGGLMMIYGLYPGVPLANVKALMDAMERYAGYYA
jgi:uroporphyrinogen decarboxylase